MSHVGYENNQLYRPVKYIRILCYCYQDILIALHWAGSYPIYANLRLKVALYGVMILLALNICLIEIVESAKTSTQLKNAA